MAGGSYFEVEARVVSPGIVSRVAALVEPAAQAAERRLREAIERGLNARGVSARVQGTRLGSNFADAFDRELKTKMRAALNSLPEGKARLLIDGSPAERELAKIRADIARLADAEIGVDLTDKAALARLEELKVRLTRLTAPEHDIRVRVNSGAALAELAAIKLATTQATGAVENVGSGGVGRAGLFVPGIVAALTTVGPLAAAAAGGLLGAAGAAGVLGLAVMGVRRQMEQQVGVGQEISEQFKGISREANGLADIAANAIGPGIEDVLDRVHDMVPQFEGLTALVGGRLGGAFREGGDALLTAFHKAQPLIVDVAGYLEQGASALSRWVASQSFDRFLTYARQQLPVIIGYAKDFGTAIVDTFKAFTTTGEGVLKTLDLIAKGTSFLADHTHDDKGNSLFGNLFGYGWADNTKKDSNTASDAIDQLLVQYQALFNGTAKLSQVSAPLDEFKTVTGDLVPALLAATGSGNAFSAAATGIVARLRAATPELQTFMDTAAEYATKTGPTLADTAKLLSDALTASRGYALDYVTALVTADTATLSLSKTVHDNLASIANDGTLLGVSHLNAAGQFVAAAGKYTQGSSEIAAAFQQQVQAATNAAASTYTQVKASTGDSVQAGNAALTVYKGLRDQLIGQARDAGATAQQVEALSDQYFAIPPSVDTFVQLLGQGNVNLAIQGLTDALNRLSDFIGAPTVTLNSTALDNALKIKNSDLDYFGGRLAIPSLDLSTGGFDGKAAQTNGVLDVLGSKYVAPTVGLNDQATAVVARVQAAINAMHGKTINLDIVARQAQGLDYYGNASAGTPGNPALNAQGSILDGTTKLFAEGGVISAGQARKLAARVPSYATGELLPQFTTVPRAIYGEAGPEAYIPLANDYRRPRALALWAEAGSRLGVSAAAVVADRGASSTGSDPAVLARLGAIEAAVYAAGSHVADRNDTALSNHAAAGALARAGVPREGF